MDKELKKKLTATEKWVRLFYMILFAIVSYITQIIIWIIAALQFILSLFTGKPNQNLLGFSDSLSMYTYQIYKFLTYVSEKKPFPFGSWPKPSAGGAPEVEEESSE